MSFVEEQSLRDELSKAAAALTLSDEARVRAERERDEAEQDAHELTKALTGLTCGGSEFFVRKRGRYLADILACVEWVRCRDSSAAQRALSAMHERKDAEARAQASEALVRELVEGLRRIVRGADDVSEFTTLSGDYVIRRCELEAVKALILRAENHVSSRAQTAASDAARPDSAAQSFDGKGEL